MQGKISISFYTQESKTKQAKIEPDPFWKQIYKLMCSEKQMYLDCVLFGEQTIACNVWIVPMQSATKPDWICQGLLQQK